MPNFFYNASGVPTAASRALSASVRTEFSSVAAGMQTVQDVLTAEVTGAATYAVDSGAVNAYVVTGVGLIDTASYITAYTDGLTLQVRSANANTAGSTINVNALGVKTILRRDGTPVQPGDILAGVPFTITYTTAAGAFYLSMGLLGSAGTSPTIAVGTTTTLAAGASATVSNSGTPANPILNFGIPGSATVGMQLLTVAAPNNVATVDFTASIDSTYDEYEVHFENVIPATNNVILQMQTSANAGGAWDGGAAAYDWVNGTALGAGASAASSAGDTSIQIAANVTNVAADGGVCGVLRIHDPAATASNKMISGQVSLLVNTSTLAVKTVAGRRLATAAVNGIRLKFSSGNITSGKIKLYGVRKV